jgi:tetratricopeptide (TPR) repeat protein
MSAREVLHSWKEIAAYLDRTVRTCRRWEEHLGLPIHRLDKSPKARVVAYKEEVDAWLEMKLHEHDIEKPRVPASVRFSAFARRWNATVALTIVLAIGVVGWRALNNGRPRFVPSGSRPAIAVLPFVNGTGDEGLDYLRESLPDHLIRDLQRSAEQMLVFSFEAVADALSKADLEPGAPLSPEQLSAVAERTGAGWFLTGTLSRASGKIRLDYELRGAKAVAPLKTGRLPGTEAEIAVLEGRIAAGVRRAFDIPTAAGPEIMSACSVEATRFYEAARAVERSYSVRPSHDDLERMIGLFNKAREVDPGCALAYLGLGDAYQHMFVYEGLDREALRLMEENYLRAYQMAPERAETNIGIGWVHFFRADNDQAYAFFRKAVEIDPWSLRVLTETGAFLRSIGMLERAAEYFTRVLQAGGTTEDIYMLRAWTYEHMGLYESALADFEKMIELEPTAFRTHCYRARVLTLMGRSEAAGAELGLAETLAPGDPYIGLVRALAAAARGDRAEALAALEWFKDEERPTRGTYYRSRVYAALGMLDEAVAAIELGIERGFRDIYDYYYVFPFLNNTRDRFYDALRGDPRFAEILRREELKYVENLEKYTGL